MTPTRIPPGWTFWPITGHLSSESCSPAAKRPARKDAGSARSRRLRARLRTRRAGALQRPGECEAGGRGPSLSTRFLARRWFLGSRCLCTRGRPCTRRALRLLLGWGLRRWRDLDDRGRRHLDGDVTGALADAGDAAARTRAPALDRRALVHVRRRDDEVVADQTVVRLRVRDGRMQHLLDFARGGTLGEGEDRPRLGYRAAADVLRDEPRLARRDAHPLRLGAHFLLLRSRDGRHYFFTSAFRSPEWPRNVRVGANSPSLWPTICSVTNTGTCLRPSWTAIVCPTISGKIVDARDQVRIIRFSFAAFMASIRLSSRSWTYGPFFDDLLTDGSPGDDFASLPFETQAVQGRRPRSGSTARARPRTRQCAAYRA